MVLSCNSEQDTLVTEGEEGEAIFLEQGERSLWQSTSLVVLPEGNLPEPIDLEFALLC